MAKITVKKIIGGIPVVIGPEFEKKLDFIYRVALKLAEKKSLLPLQELWMEEWNITEEDCDRVYNILMLLNSRDEIVTYEIFEDEIHKQGCDLKQSIRVTGVLYADGDARIQEIIDGWAYIPAPLKKMVKRVRGE